MNSQSVVSEPAKMANQMLQPIPDAEVEEVVMLYLHTAKKITSFSRALYPVVNQPNFWMAHKTLSSFNTCLHLLSVLWYWVIEMAPRVGLPDTGRFKSIYDGRVTVHSPNLLGPLNNCSFLPHGITLNRQQYVNIKNEIHHFNTLLTTPPFCNYFYKLGYKMGKFNMVDLFKHEYFNTVCQKLQLLGALDTHQEDTPLSVKNLMKTIKTRKVPNSSTSRQGKRYIDMHRDNLGHHQAGHTFEDSVLITTTAREDNKRKRREQAMECETNKKRKLSMSPTPFPILASSNLLPTSPLPLPEQASSHSLSTPVQIDNYPLTDIQPLPYTPTPLDQLSPSGPPAEKLAENSTAPLLTTPDYTTFCTTDDDDRPYTPSTAYY